MKLAGVFCAAALCLSSVAHADDVLTEEEAQNLSLQQLAEQEDAAAKVAAQAQLPARWIKYCIVRVSMEIAPDDPPSSFVRLDLAKIRDRKSFLRILGARNEYMHPAVTLCLANAAATLKQAGVTP